MAYDDGALPGAALTAVCLPHAIDIRPRRIARP
jgi:hypothetical protein